MIADGPKVPKNPFFELSGSKTYGHDHLTPIGENMMYNLGTAFLGKYKYLFRDPSNPQRAITPANIYRAWSDADASCQSSAVSFLTGIFPPGFKTPEIASPWFSYTKKPAYNNPNRDAYDPKISNNNSVPHNKPPVFQLRMSSEDQDFMFFTKVAEVCPKMYPEYRKSQQLIKADILRQVVKIEKFLNEKFLSDGFKELQGFEWGL